MIKFLLMTFEGRASEMMIIAYMNSRKKLSDGLSNFVDF